MRAEELTTAIKAAAGKLFNSNINPQLSRPDEKFGDYATNAALQLAKKAAATPPQIARQLAGELKSLPGISDVSIAGAGFLNFKLTDDALVWAALSAVKLPKPLRGQQILIEFGDPNPFKRMHIGHLYSYIVGDSIASLLEAKGATIRRLSYHGDVGRQVAMAIYGLMANSQPVSQDILGEAYAYGYEKYGHDFSAKQEIDEINRHIYERDDQILNQLHQQGLNSSLEHFEEILKQLSIKTDKRYFESQSTPLGLKMVKANIGKVFTQSQGAVVYEGQKTGLHTRVFITSKGLPTYETKDLGLVQLKNQDFPEAALSLVITANEQTEYFKVMLAALSEIAPGLADKTKHLAHGFVNLSTGKMSSRSGDVYAAETLIKEVEKASAAQYPGSNARNQTAFAALKYDFLKSRLGGDITFDIKQSISLEGNSGPYIQYAYARASNILAKALHQSKPRTDNVLDKAERSLARKISQYPEVIQRAADELMPHYICSFLYELAQQFNRFYESSRIIGDDREVIRLSLTKAYQNVLKHGLELLNINAPESV